MHLGFEVESARQTHPTGGLAVAIGDWRYRTRVPKEIRQQAVVDALGDPEWYIPALEVPAQYPDSARVFLAEATRRLASEAPGLLEPGDLAALHELDAASAPEPAGD